MADQHRLVTHAIVRLDDQFCLGLQLLLCEVLLLAIVGAKEGVAAIDQQQVLMMETSLIDVGRTTGDGSLSHLLALAAADIDVADVVDGEDQEQIVFTALRRIIGGGSGGRCGAVILRQRPVRVRSGLSAGLGALVDQCRVDHHQQDGHGDDLGERSFHGGQLSFTSHQCFSSVALFSGGQAIRGIACTGSKGTLVSLGL